MQSPFGLAKAYKKTAAEERTFLFDVEVGDAHGSFGRAGDRWNCAVPTRVLDSIVGVVLNVGDGALGLVFGLPSCSVVYHLL